MTDRIPNPYLIGSRGPHALLSAHVCWVLERQLGRELAALRTRLRGVDQESAYALIAVTAAAASFVPPEEQLVVDRAEQATGSVSPEWLSTAEAAELLAVGRRAIGQAIARNRLPAVKTGREWRICRTDLETYKNASAA